MNPVSLKLRRIERGYTYWCQGCEETHSVRTDGPEAWGFDGNLAAPTFSPSVLTTSGHYLATHKDGASCWCTYNAARPDNPAPFKCQRCHTFIAGGMVQFLADCTHALAGQTLRLPDLPAHLTDGHQP